MMMPGRSYTAGNSFYRYKFHGKEQDKETTGTATYDYGFRIFSPALGRFLSVDPLSASYPWNSTYAFAENDVLRCIDLDGLEKYYVINYWKNGVKQRTEIEAFKDIDTKEEINMQFKLSGAPLTDKNVVIYDVYDEGTKKESIFQSDAPELTSEQAKIFSTAFTVKKIAGGKATIRNDLDAEVADGKVSSTKGILHKQAIHTYNTDASNATGKNLNKKIDLSPGVGTVAYLMCHDIYGDGKIHSNELIENGTIAMTGSSSAGLKNLVKQIKKNGGVENINITGQFNYVSSTSSEDRKTIETGVQNFSENLKKILKSAGAKNVNVNITSGANESNLGMRNVIATY